MKELVRTDYLLHGGSSLPEWALAIIALAGVVMMIRWMRAHHGKGVAGKLLYVTGPLLVLLLVWLIWRPTLVRIDHWREPSQLVAYVDTSGSMDVPLAGLGDDALVTLLDLLPTDLTTSRDTAAGAFADMLVGDVDAVGDLKQAVRDRLDLYDQGLPPGDALSTVATDHAKLVAEWRERWPSAAIDVRGTGDEGDNAVARPLAEAIEAVLSALDRTPAAIDTNSRDQLDRARASLDAVHAAAKAVIPLLRERQRTLDQAWAESAGGDVPAALDELRAQTRASAAAQLVAASPAIAAAVERESSASQGSASAGLFGAIEQRLDDARGEPVSNLVIIADGANESAIDADLVARVRKAGLRVTVVGAGVPESQPDAAIVDWQLPRVARAGRTMRVPVMLKTAADTALPLTLQVTADGEELLRYVTTTDDKERGRTVLTFDAPKEGRYRIAIRIVESDANPGNNVAYGALDAVRTDPDVALIGDLPDWDTAYVYLAMRRVGLDARQVFHAGTDEPPRRGGSSSAIPSSESQWKRNEVVVLKGSMFEGFADEDAQALRTYVLEGGSLIIMAGSEAGGGYVSALSSLLSVSDSAPPIEQPRVRLAANADGSPIALPLMRLGTDAEVTRSRLSHLRPAHRAAPVLPQDVTLLTDDAGTPLASLGFYGRGKVYLWGISGLSEMASYADAALVDRLLDQLVADAAAPLFSHDDATLTAYPAVTLAGPGAVNAVLHTSKSEEPSVGEHELVAIADPGSMVLELGGEKVEAEAVSNPTAERVFYEFNEPFLREVASQMGGEYVTLQAAPQTLTNLTPRDFESATAERTPLATSVWLLVLITIVGAAHWTLRKLAGVAI